MIVKIVSDGKGERTKMLNHDGSEIHGISRITTHPIMPHCLVAATVEFLDVGLEMLATWDSHPLKLWADRKVANNRAVKSAR